MFSSIIPRESLLAIKIHDATPEIITTKMSEHGQSLETIIRHNRLIDLFLEIVSFSLQNHPRESPKMFGQIKISEIYLGEDRLRRKMVVPLNIGVLNGIGLARVQHDVLYCQEQFPDAICRPVSAQFMQDDKIALFELMVVDGKIQVWNERHYQLVTASDLFPAEFELYFSQS
jgi:hypothetical protein